MIAGRARSGLDGRVLIAISALLFVSGCCTTRGVDCPPAPQPGPVDDATWGRQRLEDARRSGSNLLTLHFHSGTLRVAKDFELQPDRFCATVIATRGAGRRNDDWISYDTTRSPDPRWCVGYAEILDVQVGDARWSG